MSSRIEISKSISADVVHVDVDNKIVIKNDAGGYVACLYVMPDGNLHQDSWIHDEYRIKQLAEEIANGF